MKKIFFSTSLLLIFLFNSNALTAQNPAVNPIITIIDRQPDLVPFMDTVVVNGILRVTVKNIGNADAPACHAELSTNWKNNQWQGQGTGVPAIPAGGSVVIRFKYPFKYCERAFKLKVDKMNLVPESNENNNTRSCN